GLNYDLVAGRTNHFKTDIEAYINEHKTSQRAVRKDAVLVNEWIISSDSNFFAELTAADTRKYFETVLLFKALRGTQAANFRLAKLALLVGSQP
ncbi:plasmid recombination protein, partial [Lactiplantibacillus pentosus]|uniref:plasmid recombination protein n=1 Tax=Lactiplantibacillus pentosus TaxID=1589 RepID=UPI003C1DA69D